MPLRHMVVPSHTSAKADLWNSNIKLFQSSFTVIFHSAVECETQMHTACVCVWEHPEQIQSDAHDQHVSPGKEINAPDVCQSAISVEDRLMNECSIYQNIK